MRRNDRFPNPAIAVSNYSSREWLALAANMRLHAELRVLLPNVETDGVGFEPTSDFRRCRFSRPVHSTALPPILATAPCAADAEWPILTCFHRRPDEGFDGLSAVS